MNQEPLHLLRKNTGQDACKFLPETWLKAPPPSRETRWTHDRYMAVGFNKVFTPNQYQITRGPVIIFNKRICVYADHLRRVCLALDKNTPATLRLCLSPTRIEITQTAGLIKTRISLTPICWDHKTREHVTAAYHIYIGDPHANPQPL